MGKLTHVERQAERYKAQLKMKFAKKGSYENFGQTEVKKLKDAFVDDMDSWKTIQSFNEWCMTYDG